MIYIAMTATITKLDNELALKIKSDFGEERILPQWVQEKCCHLKIIFLLNSLDKRVVLSYELYEDGSVGNLSQYECKTGRKVIYYPVQQQVTTWKPLTC